MQITLHIPEFARKERNLHCDVVHITTKWVFRLTLDHAIAAIQTSRSRPSTSSSSFSSSSSSPKAGFTLRTQIYGAYADHFAHLGRVFSATNADLRRRDRAGAEYLNTPAIRRILRVDAGLPLANSPQPMRIRKLLRDI